jgi:hypothetical protein
MIGFFILVPSLKVLSQSKNDLSEKNIKGKVKSIKEIDYIAADTLGKIRKIDILSNDTYEYDQRGNIIEINSHVLECFGDDQMKFSYIYDSSGNKIEENFYASGSLQAKYYFKYDSKRNIIEQKDSSDGGILVHKYNYRYDSTGKIIEENILHDKYPFKNTFKYDNKGNKIEIYDYNSDGSFKKYSFKYEYDKNDNWIYSIGFDNEIPDFITERQIEYY